MGGGAAAFEAGGEEAPADPTLDPATLEGLKTLFPAAAAPLDAMAALLRGPGGRRGARGVPPAARGVLPARRGRHPGRRRGRQGGREPADRRTADAARRPHDALRAVPGRAGGGRGDARRHRAAAIAGLGDALGGLLHGAKEALRQATYWQMKNRAGTVGRNGLGPVLGRLPAGVRVHLVGHSFGARLVSFALAGLPAGAPSPVRAVTLLQGAFSHFAFASPLPFDAGRSGALAGMLARIDGPLVACFSSHDGAVGTFYPLASFAAREDAAAADDALSRWGGMGADGAQGVDAALDGIRGVGSHYAFAPGRALNIDASEVVFRGRPAGGAHSDIVHPELTWVVLAAGGLG